MIPIKQGNEGNKEKEMEAMVFPYKCFIAKAKVEKGGRELQSRVAAGKIAEEKTKSRMF